MRTVGDSLRGRWPRAQPTRRRGRRRPGDLRDQRRPGEENDLPGALPAGGARQARLPDRRRRDRRVGRRAAAPARPRSDRRHRRRPRRGRLRPARRPPLLRPGRLRATPTTFERVGKAIGDAKRPVFYLEIPPSLFATVVDGLGEAGLTENAHVVIEKPFGHDLESARELNVLPGQGQHGRSAARVHRVRERGQARSDRRAPSCFTDRTDGTRTRARVTKYDFEATFSATFATQTKSTRRVR